MRKRGRAYGAEAADADVAPVALHEELVRLGGAGRPGAGVVTHVGMEVEETYSSTRAMWFPKSPTTGGPGSSRRGLYRGAMKIWYTAKGTSRTREAARKVSTTMSMEVMILVSEEWIGEDGYVRLGCDA